MEIVFDGSEPLTESDYPNEVKEIACQYFRWLCEKEEEKYGLRRFSDTDLRKALDDHANMTELYSVDLKQHERGDGNIVWLEFKSFYLKGRSDAEEVAKWIEEHRRILIEASLQVHLAYHDHLSKVSRIKFHFPLFEDEWRSLRTANQPRPGDALIDERRPPGRPGIDYNWLRTQLKLLWEAGELPDLEGHWRSNVAEILRRVYQESYPGISPRKPPKMETIRDKMRSDFDELQQRYMGE